MPHRLEEGAGDDEIILAVVPAVGIEGERAVRLLQRQQLPPLGEEALCAWGPRDVACRLPVAPCNFRLQLLGQRRIGVFLDIAVQERRRLPADLVRLRMPKP